MSVSKSNHNDRLKRTKRVKLIKRIILILMILAILFPTVLCLISFSKIRALEEAVRQLKETTTELQEQWELEKKEEAEGTQTTISQNALSEADENVQADPYENKRKVYLTFDDGPSENTSEILDILQEYNVKATFFVVGKTDEVSKDNYRRIVAEGHTLGMHSYSHKYNEIYSSLDAYSADLIKLQDYLFEITGVKSLYVRFPGGSSNNVSKVDMQDLIAYLDEQKITYYDWNISCGDADTSNLKTDVIVNNCLEKLKQYKNEAMILMHDANDKDTTVDALPIIIENILKMDDTVMLPITEDTVPIQHVLGSKN